MQPVAALQVAIDLILVPSRVRRVRSHPLAEGVSLLLRIGAGDEDAQREAVAASGRGPALIRAAALFYIEQILLGPESDNYRVLGSQPTATTEELRRNMALLLRGMHPDHANGDRSLFASRVTGAWNAVKTPERRAAYDAALQRASANGNTHRAKRGGKLLAKAITKRLDSHAFAKTSGPALAHYRPLAPRSLMQAFRLWFVGARR